jgi:hypothetical protein
MDMARSSHGFDSTAILCYVFVSAWFRCSWPLPRDMQWHDECSVFSMWHRKWFGAMHKIGRWTNRALTECNLHQPDIPCNAAFGRLGVRQWKWNEMARFPDMNVHRYIRLDAYICRCACYRRRSIGNEKRIHEDESLSTRTYILHIHTQLHRNKPTCLHNSVCAKLEQWYRCQTGHTV